ncbi:hypothetical protein O1L68_11105 [Streptomyces lydicus]|nr:hypothetical protein [Streptomyces lydicus]
MPGTDRRAPELARLLASVAAAGAAHAYLLTEPGRMTGGAVRPGAGTGEGVSG